MTVFDYVAFFAMAVVFGAVVYIVIWLGDMPGKIARSNKHPQPKAVTAMGWFGLLFTGGVVKVGVPNSAARYRMDRWLRGGGEALLRRQAKAPVTKVRVVTR